jgi:hypothetical protein
MLFTLFLGSARTQMRYRKDIMLNILEAPAMYLLYKERLRNIRH